MEGFRTGNDLLVAILSVRVNKDGYENENKPNGKHPGDKQQWIGEHDPSPPFRQQNITRLYPASYLSKTTSKSRAQNEFRIDLGLRDKPGCLNVRIEKI
jgi:hypothetical protein